MQTMFETLHIINLIMHCRVKQNLPVLLLIYRNVEVAVLQKSTYFLGGPVKGTKFAAP